MEKPDLKINNGPIILVHPNTGEEYEYPKCFFDGTIERDFNDVNPLVGIRFKEGSKE